MRSIMKRAAGSLATAQQRVAKPASLEEMLAECMNWGRPFLFCSKRLTWSCNVDLNTDHAFIQGEVKSGFGHETPAEAARAVLEQLRQLPSPR